MSEAEARVERIQREIARREAVRPRPSTSELQAAHVLGRGHNAEDVTEDDVVDGDGGGRREINASGGDRTSRTQARQIIAGPRRLPSRSWTSEEES